MQKNRRSILKAGAALIVAPAVILPRCEAIAQNIVINPPTPGIPPSIPPGVGHMANYIPVNTRRIRAALANVRAGTASAYIACLGDSNTRGTGSAADATQGYNGWPNQLASLLSSAKAAIPSQCENFFGTGGYGGAFATYDNRIVITGGVSQPTNGLCTVGGYMFNFTSAGSLTFTTVSVCAQADIYWFGASGNGTISWQVDGGAATNIVTNQGTSGLYKTTISLGAAGTHAIAINWVSGSSYLVGIDAYDINTPKLHILNWGWHGSTTAHWTNQFVGSTTSATSKWIPLNCIPQFFQPAGIIGPALGINDMNNSNNLSAQTVMANKQLMLSSWAGISDTILLTEGPSAAANVPSLTVQQQYNALDYVLAGNNQIPIIDELGYMGDEPGAEALGLYNSSDHLHKTKSGDAVTAQMAFQALMGLL